MKNILIFTNIPSTLIPPRSSIVNLCSGRSSYQESETEHFTWDAATQLTPQSQIEDLQISRLRQNSSPNPEYSSECNKNHSLDNILNADSFTWDLTPTSPQSQIEGLGVPATLIPLQFSTPNLDSSSDSFSQSSTPAHSNNEESRNRCWKAGCDGREFSTVGNLVRHERKSMFLIAKSFARDVVHVSLVHQRGINTWNLKAALEFVDIQMAGNAQVCYELELRTHRRAIEGKYLEGVDRSSGIRQVRMTSARLHGIVCIIIYRSLYIDSYLLEILLSLKQRSLFSVSRPTKTFPSILQIPQTLGQGSRNPILGDPLSFIYIRLFDV